MSKPVYRPFIGNRGQLYRVRLAFSMFKVSIEKSEALLLMISNLRLPIRVPSIHSGKKITSGTIEGRSAQAFFTLEIFTLKVAHNLAAANFQALDFQASGFQAANFQALGFSTLQN